MTRIHLNRDRQNLGQFSPEEVSAGLSDGRFRPTDLAWRAGMETWQPLSTFTDLPPAPETVEEAAPSLAPGSGLPLTGAEAHPLASGHRPSWEKREQIGLPRAAVETVREVLTEPIQTFRDLALKGGLVGPLIFTVAMQVVCGLASLLIGLAWVALSPREWFPQYGADPLPQFAIGAALAAPAMVMAAVVSPFLMGAIYFGIMKLVTKSTADYEAVFRVCCYVSGSLAAFNLLPIPPLTWVQISFAMFLLIVVIVYQVVAFREALGLSTASALLVVTLPLALCCGFAIALSVGVAGLAAAGNLPH